MLFNGACHFLSIYQEEFWDEDSSDSVGEFYDYVMLCYTLYIYRGVCRTIN